MKIGSRHFKIRRVSAFVVCRGNEWNVSSPTCLTGADPMNFGRSGIIPERNGSGNRNLNMDDFRPLCKPQSHRSANLKQVGAGQNCGVLSQCLHFSSSELR